MDGYQIDNYFFGQITIDGRTYHKDVIILPNRIIDRWWRERGHYLQLNDLNAVFDEELEVLVVGQGTFSRMQVAGEIFDICQNKGIELICLPSMEACDKYNALSKISLTAAAIHLTC